MRHFYTILFILCLGACTTFSETKNTLADKSVVAKEKVYIDGKNRIHYNGKLDLESNKKILTLYQTSESKPTMLVIKSRGGSVALGIELGLWVHANQLDVMIDSGCASSCANYIFTAGKNKYLSKDSILIWHGSSFQDDMNEQVNLGVEWAVKWRNQDNSFFAKIGVDPKITVYGFDSYSFWDHLISIVLFDPIEGFDYSIADMERLGLKNIQLIDDDWNWRKYRSGYNVKRAELPLDYVFEPDFNQ